MPLCGCECGGTPKGKKSKCLPGHNIRVEYWGRGKPGTTKGKILSEEHRKAIGEGVRKTKGKQRKRRPWTEEQKEARRQLLKIKWEDPNYRDRVVAGRRRQWQNLECCEKTIASRKRLAMDPKRREQFSQASKMRWSDPEKRKKGLIQLRGIWDDPHQHELVRERMLKRIQNNGGANPGVHTKRGIFPSLKNGDAIPFESSYELRAFEILEVIPQVKSFQRCPFVIEYLQGGYVHEYHPDILVEDHLGHKVMIEIKPYKRIIEKLNQMKIEAARKFCGEHGITFSVWTEKEYNKKEGKEHGTFGHVRRFLMVDVKPGELLEYLGNLQGHNVAGNGKRDGVKTLWEQTISSQAPRSGEGSEAIPKGSRAQVSSKHPASSIEVNTA